MKAICLAAVVCCVAPGAAQAQKARQATLTIDVHGLRSDQGKVVLALFNSKEGFPKQPGRAHRRAAAAIKHKKARVTIRDLAPGTYAVSVFHDENGNKKLERDWIGRPKEGTGASRDARGAWGPPKFKDARLKLGSSKKTIKIRMRYR